MTSSIDVTHIRDEITIRKGRYVIGRETRLVRDGRQRDPGEQHHGGGHQGRAGGFQHKNIIIEIKLFHLTNSQIVSSSLNVDNFLEC